MRLLSHSDLCGFSNVGEGIGLQKTADGRRVLWLGPCEPAEDVTAVDVTDPRVPRVILQTDLPHSEMRSNCLALVGDILYVAHQVDRKGLPDGGLDILDVTVPESPRRIGRVDDTTDHDPAPKNAGFSRGVGYVWCVDGEYAHLQGQHDPIPSPGNPKDCQFYVIVDVRDPARPVEAGRWWAPGVMEGDARPPLQLPEGQGTSTCHNIDVYQQRPGPSLRCWKVQRDCDPGHR